jgi:hypothetical protein
VQTSYDIPVFLRPRQTTIQKLEKPFEKKKRKFIVVLFFALCVKITQQQIIPLIFLNR